MPGLTISYVKGFSGIVVPVEYEFMPEKKSDGRPNSKWANAKHWNEIYEMVKEATEDAINAAKFAQLPPSKIIARGTTAMGYNLEINGKYLDLSDSGVRYWSDDEEDDDGETMQSVSKYYIKACIIQRSRSDEYDKRAIANHMHVRVDSFTNHQFRPVQTSTSRDSSSQRAQINSAFQTVGVTSEAVNDPASCYISNRSTIGGSPTHLPCAVTPRSTDDDLNWNSMPKESYYEERDDEINDNDSGHFGYSHDGGEVFMRDIFPPEDDEELPDIDYTPMIIPTTSPVRDISKSPRKRTSSGAGHTSRKRKEKTSKRKSIGFLCKVDSQGGQRNALRKDNCLNTSNEKGAPSPPLNSTTTGTKKRNPGHSKKTDTGKISVTRRRANKFTEKEGRSRRNSTSVKASRRKTLTESPSPGRSKILSRDKENLPSTQTSSFSLIETHANELCKEAEMGSTRRESAKNNEKAGIKRQNSASGLTGKRKKSSENASPCPSASSKRKENLPSTLMSSFLLPEVATNANDSRNEIDSEKTNSAQGSSATLSLMPPTAIMVAKSSTSSVQNRVGKVRKERTKKERFKNNILGPPDNIKLPSVSKLVRNKTGGSLNAEKSIKNGAGVSPNSSTLPRGRYLRTAAERKVYSDSSQSFVVPATNRDSVCSELGFPDPEMPVLVPEILNTPDKLTNNRCHTPPVPILSPEGEDVARVNTRKEIANAESTVNNTTNTNFSVSTPGSAASNDLSPAVAPCTSKTTSVSSFTQSPVASGKNQIFAKKKRGKKIKRSFKNGAEKPIKGRRQSQDEILPPIRKLKKAITKFVTPSTIVTNVQVPSTNDVQTSISNKPKLITTYENTVAPCPNELAITVSIFPPPTCNVEVVDGNLNIHGHSLNQIVQTSNQSNVVCLEIHTTPTQPVDAHEDGSDVSLKCSSFAFLSIQQNYASDEENDNDVAADFSTDSAQKNDYCSSSIPELDPGELDRLDLNLCDLDHVYNESELHLLDPGDTLGDPSNLAKYLNFDGSDDDQGFSNHRSSNKVVENSELERSPIARRSSTGESPSISTSLLGSLSQDANTKSKLPFFQMATFVRTDLQLRTPSPPHSTSSVASTPTSFETIEEVPVPVITNCELLPSKNAYTIEITPDTAVLKDRLPLGKSVNNNSEMSGKQEKTLRTSKKTKKSGTIEKVVFSNNDELLESKKVTKQKRRRSPMLNPGPTEVQVATVVPTKKSKAPPEIPRKVSSRKKDIDELSESAYSASSSVCRGSIIQAAKVREHLKMYKKNPKDIDENHIKLCLKFLTEQNKTLHKAVRNITHNGSRRAKLWNTKTHENREEIMKRLKSWDILWPFSESQKAFVINELKIKLRDDYMNEGEDFIKYVAFPEAAIRVYALCCGCDNSFANCEKEMLVKSRRIYSH